ncbi:ribosome small subunit-dependent GTPase A [Methylophilus sp. VKM B-3414]|uniref:ribosome small subunit-dependent GTPase A n=1 Tax=Methylophilus sp. VKM B-3414 TaxID=3076121 RepID=UPI0028CA2DB7|nr:ribosome small subunit-dependent GTPase A [Methylophilus sp. VKM B-3414]MDT7850112.1 ribosome small subunit-dependent GTPase A [Methylophilus sp. VKM B-3414]
MSYPGLIVAAYGKRYNVELPDGRILSCVTRGKKVDNAAGDRVTVTLTASNEGVIEKTAERTTLLYRSNAYKSKVLAANVTQILIVLATQPSFYEDLLNRCLVAAEAAGIRAVILLNKCDLPNPQALQKLEQYAALGYLTLQLNARQSVEALKPLLAGHTSVLVGQSGMGKSTIINSLLPEARSKTQEISTTLDSGKHTTTATHLYHLDQDSAIIDSPGLQEFGLYHINETELEYAFVEFRPFIGHCKFNNCTHTHEPDCAILKAVQAGSIPPERLQIFQQIRSENSVQVYG